MDLSTCLSHRKYAVGMRPRESGKGFRNHSPIPFPVLMTALENLLMLLEFIARVYTEFK